MAAVKWRHCPSDAFSWRPFSLIPRILRWERKSCQDKARPGKASLWWALLYPAALTDGLIGVDRSVRGRVAGSGRLGGTGAGSAGGSDNELRRRGLTRRLVIGGDFRRRGVISKVIVVIVVVLTTFTVLAAMMAVVETRGRGRRSGVVRG